jgi:hypothetical protein
VLSALFQEPWTYNEGLGWDGAQYVALASQCGREPMRASEPFAYRIGAPCLAALLPWSPKHALWIVNAAASVLLLLLLDVWLRRHVERRILPWLLAGFALHWLTPLRHVWWYPTYIDPLALCAMLGALLLVQRRWLFVAVCFAGALIRETMLIVPAGILAGQVLRELSRTTPLDSQRRLRDTTLLRTAVGITACLAAAVLTRLVVTPTTDYWMLDSALYWAYEKPLPRYVLALFITFGPALVLLALQPRAVRAYFKTNPEQGAILLLVLALAWIGGTDTERFLLWGSPIVLALLGKAAEHMKWREARGPAVLLLVGQAINGRWFVTTPDHVLNEVPRHWPLLTPITAERSALLFSETPDRMMSAVALLQYLTLTIVLFAWFKWREQRHVQSGAESDLAPQST